jgi:hypothetical protein
MAIEAFDLIEPTPWPSTASLALWPLAAYPFARSIVAGLRAVGGRPMNRRTPSHAFTPMTLGNMRELGVRSLAVTCELCHSKAILSADRWPDTILVRAFGARMNPGNPAMRLVWEGS